MKKNGTTKKGTIRWRCGTCNISETKRRTDNTNAKWFRLFYSHITGKSTREDIAKQAGVCLATVDKKFKTMWFIQVPHIPDNHTVHDQVFIDGTHLGGGCLLIASTLTHVLNWHWCKGETTKDYMELLRPLAPPLIVTLDGGQGARTAIRRLWPETKIQRCLIHAVRYVRQQTSSNPKTIQGKEILAIARKLTSITTMDEAEEWKALLEAFKVVWQAWMNERTTYKTADGRRREDWTHKAVRTAYNSLERLVKADALFTYLNPPEGVIHPDKIQTTTNALEGGFNAGIKRLADQHRGRSTEHQRTMIDWWLYTKTEAPDDPEKIARQQQWGRKGLGKAHAVAQIEKQGQPDDGRPALYDNAVDRDYSHSLGIRRGQL